VKEIVGVVKVVTLLLSGNYQRGTLMDEDHLTGGLVFMLETFLSKLSVEGIQVIPKAFSLKEEREAGADLGVLLNVDIPGFKLSKAFIAQAKKCECEYKYEYECFRDVDYRLSGNNLGNIVDQCQRMLGFTSSAFVLVYTNNSGCGILAFPAGDVIALSRVTCNKLSALYAIRLDQLFEYFMKCYIGDPMIAKAYWGFDGLVRLMAEYKIRHGLLLMLRSEEERFSSSW